jgi:hypothetical protein
LDAETTAAIVKANRIPCQFIGIAVPVHRMGFPSGEWCGRAQAFAASKNNININRNALTQLGVTHAYKKV